MPIAKKAEFFAKRREAQEAQTASLAELLDQTKENIKFKDVSSQCPKCKNFTVRFVLRQCRSADEGEVPTFVCFHCNPE